MDGERMAAEIAEQPAIFRRLLDDGLPAIQEVAAAINRRRPRFVLLAARGTSDHAALYAQYLAATVLGLPAGLISPSTTTIYGAASDMRDVLFIAVSQSGASPDLIEPLTAARSSGAITLALTNAAGSQLAGAAEFSIDILAGPEEAVAATKTYTAELLTLYLLMTTLAGRHDEDVRRVPELAEHVLALEPRVAEITLRYRFAEQLLVTSRGYNYATAREAGLKLMETCNLVAHAFSGADLLHGPMAMVRRGFPVIAIIPDGPGGSALRPVMDRLGELSADILVVGSRQAVAGATIGLELPPLGPEILSPLLMILPLQQLARHLALLRGTDPDQPEGLTKITRTR